MKPQSAVEIRGTWGTVILPLNEDESVDYVALEAQVDEMISAGLDGIYTNGTAGEFYAQSEAEYDRICAIVAERCTRKSVPFQLGVSHMSAQTSLERLRRAKHHGPVAVQIILPDWLPLSEPEMTRFLARVAETADPIGLVLYTPAHAKQRVDLPLLARLRRAVAALVGVKTPAGDAAWYEQMRRELPRFSVFVPGHHLATGIAQGASGSYSNIACLSPRGAQQWYRLMMSDMAAALAFEARLLAFLQAEVLPFARHGFCNTAIDKALCAAGGWCPMPARLRWPYLGISDGEILGLRRKARAALPELFG